MKCEQCKGYFKIEKHFVQSNIKRGGMSGCFCSDECTRNYKLGKIYLCCYCQKPIYKTPSQLKSLRQFCSQSCSGKYSSSHKSYGYKRSKLESWLESQLTVLYPKLKIEYNNTETINAELDIYIPSLKLAFELNGIFHYEPIFGQEKLNQTKNNDQRKFQACLEKNIELCIIDTTTQKYFKKHTSQKFLDIIVRIINQKIA